MRQLVVLQKASMFHQIGPVQSSSRRHGSQQLSKALFGSAQTIRLNEPYLQSPDCDGRLFALGVFVSQLYIFNM